MLSWREVWHHCRNMKTVKWKTACTEEILHVFIIKRFKFRLNYERSRHRAPAHLWTTSPCYITNPPIPSAVPKYWSTFRVCVCVYLPRSWRRAAAWQLLRSPKPTPPRSRRTPARPEDRSLLWKSHQLQGRRKKNTTPVIPPRLSLQCFGITLLL